jgi:YD repeat-containing protein
MKKKIKSTTVYRINTVVRDLTASDSEAKAHKYSYSSFTEDGRLLTEERYNDEGEVEEKYEYRYDDQGRLLEEITYLDEDMLAEHKTYERNGDGTVVKAFKHYQDGEKDTIDYKRDRSGRLVEKVTIDSYGEVEAKEVIDYSDKRVTDRKIYEYDELVLEESYDYDDEGNMTEHTKWTVEDENARFRNVFDPQGNLIQAMKYDLKGNLLSIVKYRYVDNKLVGIIDENQYGTNTTTLIHDDRGNPIEQAEVDQDGELNNKATRKYNENNDVTEAEIFINTKGRGVNQHYILKYEYEYYG